MTRTLPTVALASILALGALPAAAAPATDPAVTAVQWNRRAVPRESYQRIYEQGYRTGLREGERDARDRRARDYRQHSEFRRGTRGWGNDGAADDAYRRGFAEGYLQGYDRVRNDSGWWGRPGRGGYGYPGGGYGYPGGRPGYYSPAAQRGFEDGYREGLDAARDDDRYDPTREKKYREGDEGYERRYGSKDQYKSEYRQAFRQGYDRGYREGRYR